MADQVPLLKPSKDVPRCAGARSRMLKKIFKSKNKKSTKSRESAGNAKQTRRKPQKKSKKPKPKPRRATAARDGKQKKEPSKAKLKGLSPPKGDYPFGRRSREKESKGSGSKEKDGPIRRSRGKPCRRSGSEEREGTVRRSEEKGNKEGASKSKEVSLQTNSTMKSISSEEAQSCTFDKTQWERTRFAAEAVNDKKSAEPENKAQMKEETMRRESALLGESRQSVAVKGEYLTRKPMPTIVVLFTELLWSITCLMGWSIFADNPLTPTLLAIFNFILMSLLTLGCLSIEFLRYQVRREDNKSETRFFIPYIWRFSENHGKGSYKGIQLKGLSPPKEDFVFRKKGGTDNIEAPKDADISARTWPTITSGSLEGGRFDKTQWERTRFATEATRKSAEIIEKPLNTEEQPAKETSAEAPLIGESRQSMAVRGGYLNTRPTGVILLLTIELILCVTCVVVWATVAENPLTPQLIVVANLVAVFFFILVCLSVEFFRYQVRREDNKSETRFFVPYNWRFSLFEAHLARAALLGANITIIAVEKTFDTGSIIVLVASPIHLLLVVVHVFSALKPKR